MKDQQEIDQIGAMIREARSAQNMTRQQLADKCGITKSRISKAENDIGDVPFPSCAPSSKRAWEPGCRSHLNFKYKWIP